MKRSKLVLAAGIIGTLYLIYLVSYFAGGIASSDGAGEAVGAGLATVLVMPHMVYMFLYAMFVLLEMIFCFVAFAKMKQAEQKTP